MILVWPLLEMQVFTHDKGFFGLLYLLGKLIHSPVLLQAVMPVMRNQSVIMLLVSVINLLYEYMDFPR